MQHQHRVVPAGAAVSGMHGKGCMTLATHGCESPQRLILSCHRCCCITWWGGSGGASWRRPSRRRLRRSCTGLGTSRRSSAPTRCTTSAQLGSCMGELPQLLSPLPWSFRKGRLGMRRKQRRGPCTILAALAPDLVSIRGSPRCLLWASDVGSAAAEDFWPGERIKPLSCLLYARCSAG